MPFNRLGFLFYFTTKHFIRTLVMNFSYEHLIIRLLEKFRRNSREKFYATS